MDLVNPINLVSQSGFAYVGRSAYMLMPRSTTCRHMHLSPQPINPSSWSYNPTCLAPGHTTHMNLPSHSSYSRHAPQLISCQPASHAYMPASQPLISCQPASRSHMPARQQLISCQPGTHVLRSSSSSASAMADAMAAAETGLLGLTRSEPARSAAAAAGMCHPARSAAAAAPPGMSHPSSSSCDH